jgi:hypothetical protein
MKIVELLAGTINKVYHCFLLRKCFYFDINLWDMGCISICGSTRQNGNALIFR